MIFIWNIEIANRRMLGVVSMILSGQMTKSTCFWPGKRKAQAWVNFKSNTELKNTFKK